MSGQLWEEEGDIPRVDRSRRLTGQLSLIQLPTDDMPDAGGPAAAWMHVDCLCVLRGDA